MAYSNVASTPCSPCKPVAGAVTLSAFYNCTFLYRIGKWAGFAGPHDYLQYRIYMNILIMTLGGAQREKKLHMHELVLRLALREDVKLVVASSPNSPLAALAREKGIEFISCHASGAGALASRLKLLWRLRKPETPWIIHAFDQDALSLGIKVASKKGHINIVYSAFKPELFREKQILENIHLINAVVTETKHTAEHITPYGFIRSSIFVIPSGINPDLYQQRFSRPEKPDDCVLFASSAPLEEGRGYEELAEGLAALYAHDDLPRWEFRIAASGPLFDSFLAKAEALNADARLGIFDEALAQQILPDCDIFIDPALESTSSSLNIKEGWAMGLPVICSDSSANRELVEHGKNALLFEGGNAADLAAKMAQLAKNPILREELARGGQDALPQHSLDKVAQAHLALYTKIIGENTKLAALDM